MPATNLITMQPRLHLVQPFKPSVPSILAAEFLPNLERFNELTREMRAAGIVTVGIDFPDNCLVIDEEHAELLTRRFAHEIRSVRVRKFGGFIRKTVSIRSIDIVWFELAKEQRR